MATNNNKISYRKMMENEKTRKQGLIEKNPRAFIYEPESPTIQSFFKKFALSDSIDVALRMEYGNSVSHEQMNKWLSLLSELEKAINDAYEYGKNILVENGKTRNIGNPILRREIKKAVEAKEKAGEKEKPES